MKELKEDIIEAVQDATDIVDGTVSIPILEHFLDEILTEQCNIADVRISLPEYNEILYHAKTLSDEQFREYWNEVQGNVL